MPDLPGCFSASDIGFDEAIACAQEAIEMWIETTLEMGNVIPKPSDISQLQKLKEFKEDLKDGLQSLLKMSAAATGALYGIDKFLDGAIETANEIRNIHNQTGLAEESIQRDRKSVV